MEEKREVLIYRIIQEACNNVIKYAECNQLLIQLLENDEEYVILIEDDGKGFDMTKINYGIGLNSMKSRVALLNGNIDIASQIGKGTTLSINLPKKHDEAA